MARLFFALWPAEDALRALAATAAPLAVRLGGRATAAGKIHMTLAFLGEVTDDAVLKAHAAAAEVAGRPFSLVLDRLGAFRRAGVAWAGASSPDRELLRLQQVLAAGLSARGFQLEARPFAPHVTLVRKIGRAMPEEAMEAIAWRVADFALVRSETGTGRYTTMERWALR